MKLSPLALFLLVPFLGRRSRPSTSRAAPPRQAPPAPSPPTGQPSPGGQPPEPLIVGQRGNPEIEALLREMDDEFSSQGVDLGVATAAEVTRMGSRHGIPPRSTWLGMARTLREVFMPIRQQVGFPIRIGGYRSPEYNASLDGAPSSRHMWFEAIDMNPTSGSAKDKRRVALAAAQLYRSRGSALRMGLGIYGYPTPRSGTHVDTGWKMRTWADSKMYLDQVSRQA